MNSIALTRTILIYGIILPLAVVLGYMLTTREQSDSLMGLAVVLFVLTIPLLIRWHHPILIFSWNAAIVLAMLPGAPHFWMVMCCLSLGFAILNRILDRQGESTFCHAPPVTYAILSFTLVVLFTAKMRGGLGLHSLGGSSYGGKGYIMILAAVIAYFALTSRPIPIIKARFYTALFLLPGLTSLVSTMIYFAGPAFYPLYAIFPVSSAINMAQLEASGAYITRQSGVSGAGTVIFFFMLARYGVRELLSMTRPLRLAFFVAAFFAGLFGGFRSIMTLMLMVFSLQFYFEGLLRTRLFPTLVLVGLSVLVLAVPMADRLPLVVQRSLSSVPGIEVDPMVKYDTDNSTDWRVQMWKVLLPELHKYVFLGKGYSLDPTDLYLTDIGVRRGTLASWEGSIASGDYHNGPLSLYIPFGSLGVLAFLFFLIASIRTLHQHWQHGDPQLKIINAFLLSMFVANTISFFLVFGSIRNDFFTLAGIIGFGVALNGGAKAVPRSLPPASGSA